jgi:DNA-binding MarR family transcriptional regulator
MTKASDDDLSFPQLIKWVEMVTRGEAERTMADLPVSSTQMFVLVLLGQRGEATAADLARMMRITPQALTTLLAPLRQGGLIARRQDEDHGRRHPLRLSGAGEQLVAHARQLSPGVEQRLLEDFTPSERKVLKSLLWRIAKQFR